MPAHPPAARSLISPNLRLRLDSRASHSRLIAWLRTTTWNFVITMTRNSGLRNACRMFEAKSAAMTRPPMNPPGLADSGSSQSSANAGQHDAPREHHAHTTAVSTLSSTTT